MSKGTLIVLNGGPSAGKNTLGEALQSVLEQPYVLLGIDAFFQAFPPEQKDDATLRPEYYAVEYPHHDGRGHFRVTPGQIWDRVTYGRYRAVVALLEYGLNVISDEIFWKREWLLEAARLFTSQRAYLFGVTVSEEEAERRHIARGRSGPGWYRDSAHVAHRDAVYDLNIDTTGRTAVACASEIKAALDSGLEPTAFKRVMELFKGHAP